MLKPVERKTLHKEVMQALNEAILAGTWKVGEKLPGEIALAQTFRVSRTCIREVLKALSYSGILESRPGRGTFLKVVPNQSPAIDALGDLLVASSYADFLEMRQVLHGQAAYWACERATPEELLRLEQIVSVTEESELSNAHKLFHQVVLQLSHNPILMSVVTQLEERFKDLRELNFILLSKDRVEHIQMFEAIKNGPPSRARQVMVKHVDYLWRKVKNRPE